jgi:hypothetical protein
METASTEKAKAMVTWMDRNRGCRSGLFIFPSVAVAGWGRPGNLAEAEAEVVGVPIAHPFGDLVVFRFVVRRSSFAFSMRTSVRCSTKVRSLYFLKMALK